VARLFLWKQGDGASSTVRPRRHCRARAQDITGPFVRLQTGYLYHYAFVMLIGIAALVTWMMLGSAF
jgi:NADH-quinone oxidoreductase subunit L